VTRGGKRGGTRAEDEVRALTSLLALYERLYTKSGLPRRVARELWRHTISWVRASRRGKRSMLTRDQLRVTLRVRDTQEASFKDAVESLGTNLRILGYSRASAREERSKEESDAYRPNHEECTFPIEGVPHVVYLLGPTGKDRGDGEWNALWLEPIFEPVAEVSPVLVTPGFDELDYVGFNFSAFVDLAARPGEPWAVSGSKAGFVRTVNALAFALNRGEGLFPTDSISWSDDVIEVESPPILTPDWSAGGKIVIATTEEPDDRWRLEMFGGITVAPDERQHDVRARATSTLSASDLRDLDAIEFQFMSSTDAVIPHDPHAFSEALYRLSFPILSAEKMSATARIHDGVTLAVSLAEGAPGSHRLTLSFERTARSAELWRSVRDFDTAALLREARMVSF
jgi:hypothetical protein